MTIRSNLKPLRREEEIFAVKRRRNITITAICFACGFPLTKAERRQQKFDKVFEIIKNEFQKQNSPNTLNESAFKYVWTNFQSNCLTSFEGWSSSHLWEEFHNEIYSQVSSCELVPEEKAKEVVNSVINDLKKAFPNITSCYCYGSYYYGLACKDSDIDLSCEWSRNSEIKKFMKECEVCLKKSSLFKVLEFVDSPNVPIIKLIHKRTKKNCEISFENKKACMNSKLMKLYLSMDPALKYLVLYLKQLLQRRQLHGTGKITTNILFWLVVFFMQEKKLLPPVIDVRLRADENCKISGWDFSVPDSSTSSNKLSNLFLLLADFFKFYHEFNFLKYIISPFLGRRILVSDFNNLKSLDPTFSIYLKKVESEGENPFQNYLMNIQHPAVHAANMAIPIQDVCVINAFKLICFYAYMRLSNCASLIRGINDKNLNTRLLPRKLRFRKRQPPNLIQFLRLQKNFSDVDEEIENINLLSIIDTIMTSFDLEKKQIANIEVSMKQRNEKTITKVITHIEYCAGIRIPKNHGIKRLFPGDIRKYEPLCVNLICEYCIEDKMMNLLVQSEVHLNKFFEKHLANVFGFVYKKKE